MRLKTNVVISVVFACLLGFVWFHEIKGGEKRELEAERARQLVDFSDQEAQQLTIQGVDTTIVIERRGDEWIITEPISTGADVEAIDRYLRSLKESEIEGDPVLDSAAVAADPSALESYGLERPRLQVHLALSHSAKSNPDTLRFGNDTPTERFTYVQQTGANPEIRTIRAWRFDNLDKSVFDLRDRHVLHFDREQVTGLTLHRWDGAAGQRITAERSGAGWQITAPLQTAADDGAFDEMLTRVSNARISTFVHEVPTAANIDEAGLGTGNEFVRLSLQIGQDKEETHLRLGTKQDQGDHFAVDSSRRPIFVIDSTVVGYLVKSLDDLRDRQPFDLSKESVQGIDLVVDGETQFRAQRDSTGIGWLLTYPVDRQANDWRLNDLLTVLAEVRAEDFVADAEDILSLNVVDYGFDAPKLRMVLHMGAGESVFVEVVESQGVVYARRADVPTIFAVTEQSLQDLSPTLDEVSTLVSEVVSNADNQTQQLTPQQNSAQ